MQATYDFLDALGLDATADARDIRRAYARKLKGIDQEANPAAFQALRGAYEVALDWCAWQAEQDVQAVPDAVQPEAAAAGAGSETTAAPPITEQASVARQAFEEADRIARAAFEALGESAAELARSGRLHDEQAWQDVLRQVLAAPDMLNITARVMFEARIAHVLAAGWQDGNETLMPAACTVFAWIDDRRRLEALGQAGALVERAIVEQLVFDAQPLEACAAQRRIIALLRSATAPEKRVLRAYLPRAEYLRAQFPTMMHLVTDVDAIARWRTLCPDAPAMAHPETGDEAPQAQAQERPQRRKWWWWVLGTWMVFAVLGALLDDKERPAQRAALSEPVRFKPVPDVPSLPVTQEKLAEIRQRIDYVPRNVPAGELVVEHEVFLNTEGEVVGINRGARRSYDPAYDKAVEAAIRAAQPFPPNTALMFRLTFSARVRMVKQRPVVERAMPRPASGEWKKYAVPPADSTIPEADKEVTLPQSAEDG